MYMCMCLYLYDPGARPQTVRKSWKIMVFIVFSRNCWSKPIPKPPENPSDHFEPVSASLDHSQPILHRFYIFDFFLKTKCYLFQVFLKYFLFFFICWAPEALGPLPNCRSHFSAQTRTIGSFWNPQGTSFMTKQCPKNDRKRPTKYF